MGGKNSYMPPAGVGGDNFLKLARALGSQKCSTIRK